MKKGREIGIIMIINSSPFDLFPVVDGGRSKE